MKPQMQFDPNKTAARTPSYTALRYYFTHFSPHYIKQYDVSNAYPRADTDPDYFRFLKQSALLDGSLSFPGYSIGFDLAQQGDPKAGVLWETHRDVNLTNLKLKKLFYELGALFTQPRHISLDCCAQQMILLFHLLTKSFLRNFKMGSLICEI